MKLIIGLGNPGKEYENTRHNTGFMVLDRLSEKLNIEMTQNKFKGLYGKSKYKGEDVILLKPQTYMNLSGESIIQFVNYYKIDIENVIIIYDDIDIEPGIVKLRKKGGAGSHNGMKSVVENLKTTNFPHVRIGTGKPLIKSDLINYVIGKVSNEDYEILLNGINTGREAVEEIVKNGVDRAMNVINSKN